MRARTGANATRRTMSNIRAPAGEASPFRRRTLHFTLPRRRSFQAMAKKEMKEMPKRLFLITCPWHTRKNES
jgi:hypothetical protein